MPERYLQRVTWALLPIILWTFAGGPAYAALAVTEQAHEAQLEAARKALPRDFDDVVAELGVALKAVAANESDALEKAKSLRAEIDERDVDLRKEFADVEMMLRDKGMPEEILQRHRDFVTEYETRLSSVTAGLDQVEAGAVAPEGIFERAWFSTKILFTGDPVRQEAAAELEAQLESYRPRKVQKSFKPEDLPFRRMTPENTPKPKETAEEWRKALAEPSQNTASLQKALGVVADALLSPAQAQATDMPGPEDLAETIEVQFTPEIVALAAELNNNPVEIYNWVRNNIEFVPTWGSIQGADYCRQTRKCNAVDTSSLLVALLRTSGHPARYQFGTVEIEEQEASNWLGDFETIELAGRFAAAAGLPVTLHTRISGSQVLRIEHVWVSAYLDYFPSQAAVNRTANVWIEVDPSFKQFTYPDPVDALAISALNVNEFVDELAKAIPIDTDAGEIRGTEQILVRNQLDAALTHLIDDFSARLPQPSEVAGFRRAIIEELEVVPASSRLSVLSRAPLVSFVPSSLQHRLSIKISGNDPLGTVELDWSAALPEIASARIAVGFDIPDSEQEIVTDLIESVLSDSVGLPGYLPAGILHGRPVIEVNGVQVATGQIGRIGETRILTQEFFSPVGTTPTVENEFQLGEFIAIGLNVSAISVDKLDAHSSDVSKYLELLDDIGAGRVLESPYQGDFRGPVYGGVIDVWFAMVDQVKNITYTSQEIAYLRYPSSGLAFSDISTELVFGLPRRIVSSGFVLDVDRNLSVSESKSGDNEKLAYITQLQGAIASILEAAVPREMLIPNGIEVEAFSAIDVINEALSTGSRIFTITIENADNLLPQAILPSGMAEDIRNAVNQGLLVTVPEFPISSGGRSISAYTAINPLTGTGDYVVGQAFSGGLLWTALIAVTNVLFAVSGMAINYGIKQMTDCNNCDRIKFLFEKNLQWPGLASFAEKFLLIMKPLKGFLDVATETQLSVSDGLVLFYGLLLIAVVAVIAGPLLISVLGLTASALGGFVINALVGILAALAANAFSNLFR